MIICCDCGKEINVKEPYVETKGIDEKDEDKEDHHIECFYENYEVNMLNGNEKN